MTYYMIQRRPSPSPALWWSEAGWHPAEALGRRWATLEACRAVARKLPGVRIVECVAT